MRGNSFSKDVVVLLSPGSFPYTTLFTVFREIPRARLICLIFIPFRCKPRRAILVSSAIIDSPVE
jgi:hypothetical protein